MFIRKLLSFLLLIAFLGALTLVTRPDLHIKGHGHVQEHTQSQDHEDHDEGGHCAVCHVLGHFILEEAPAHMAPLDHPDFRDHPPALVPLSFSIQVLYTLIPRAPPVLR